MKYLLIALLLAVFIIWLGSCHIGNSPTGTVDTTYNNETHGKN